MSHRSCSVVSCGSIRSPIRIAIEPVDPRRAGHLLRAPYVATLPTFENDIFAQQ
ncbi:MAG: hypothetical protein KY391_08225 [Actinobacteria bacterium]|nr:hypothetical protein [Actinomycetota bacterium]